MHRHIHTSRVASLPLRALNVKELMLYSNKKQTAVSLKSLMETGRGEGLENFSPTRDSTAAASRLLIQVACFLHRELPVRLAHRAIKLEASPLFANSGKYDLQCTTVFNGMNSLS
jgi:hypothetical protein